MPQRFKVIALTVAAVFICYIDRVVISLAIIPMGYGGLVQVLVQQ